MGSFKLVFNNNQVHGVEIFDISGKIIARLDNQYVSACFDLSQYTRGTYTIKVIPEGITYQIVKQ